MLYATYVTGLGEPVERLLTGRGCAVRMMLDGAAVFDDREEGALHGGAFLPAFHNVYEVLMRERFKGKPLDDFMRRAIAKRDEWAGRLDAVNCERLPSLRGIPARGKAGTPARRSGHSEESPACVPGGALSIQPTFRIVTSAENKLVSVNGRLKTELEDIIAARTGLTPDRGGMGHEYLFLLRSEGYAFFLKRLTYHTAHEKVLSKGELRPELCYLLNCLSEPSPDDRVLDPFCGCGGIVRSRLAHFPCRAAYASDIDLSRLREAGTGFKDTLRVNALKPLPYGAVTDGSRNAGASVYREADINALHEWLPPGSVDKIVTDPPWGLYDAGQDIRALYGAMFAQFKRALADGGLTVLLTARKELVRELLADTDGGLAITHSYDILVSGKKAGVFVIRKEG